MYIFHFLPKAWKLFTLYIFYIWNWNSFIWLIICLDFNEMRKSVFFFFSISCLRNEYNFASVSTYNGSEETFFLSKIFYFWTLHLQWRKLLYSILQTAQCGGDFSFFLQTCSQQEHAFMCLLTLTLSKNA